MTLLLIMRDYSHPAPILNGSRFAEQLGRLHCSGNENKAR